jgi:triosephosphate isomerase
MLKDAGCQYVILGHSERRRFYLETDSLVNRKIKVALDNGLKVIFCVGETLDQRESNETRRVVQGQLEEGLSGLDSSDLQNLVIAYEPVWAIGTGKNATAEQAQEIHCFCREIIERTFGTPVAESIRIQYGGSVTPDNCGEILAQKDVDGALVGTASLNFESFYAIIESVN